MFSFKSLTNSLSSYLNICFQNNLKNFSSNKYIKITFGFSILSLFGYMIYNSNIGYEQIGFLNEINLPEKFTKIYYSNNSLLLDESDNKDGEDKENNEKVL